MYWNIYFGFFCVCFGTNDEHFWWWKDCFNSQLQYIGGKFLNIGFFSSTYKPVKKQETLKFFNKSRKVSIDLIIPEQKSIPTQKQWNFAWGEKTKTRLIHVESRAWSCCKQMNFLLFNMVEMIITKSCFFSMEGGVVLSRCQSLELPKYNVSLWKS